MLIFKAGAQNGDLVPVELFSGLPVGQDNFSGHLEEQDALLPAVETSGA
jgi:hypothetical protein